MLTNLIPQMCCLEVTMAEKYLSCRIKFEPVLENRFVFFIIEFFTRSNFVRSDRSRGEFLHCALVGIKHLLKWAYPSLGQLP